MEALSFQNITTDFITDPVFKEKKVEVAILRLDKIHPVISGNKWFKLQYYLAEAQKLQKNTIVTFGGAWSNHIIATAAVCNKNSLNSIGIIRGEEPAKLSQTLKDAKEFGMQLFFISRKDYHDKKVPEIPGRDDYYFIPEGGYGTKGAEGATTILNHCVKEHFSHVCCAVGTGTMMAGLLNSVSKAQGVTGISVMKNNFELEEKIRALLTNEHSFRLNHEYHFGGYAKHDDKLIGFMNNWYTQTHIPSDIVYSGKLFFAVNDLIEKKYFAAGSSILVIHCGGLQGNSSLPKGKLIF
ncbi:MAG: pyridoxal-phosphate dependent enzyme [Chitinophagaceae bacterium]|nr:pyridoxal-phosphate dependent enzyme [Chitinophagaceae bacterium]